MFLDTLEGKIQFLHHQRWRSHHSARLVLGALPFEGYFRLIAWVAIGLWGLGELALEGLGYFQVDVSEPGARLGERFAVEAV